MNCCIIKGDNIQFFKESNSNTFVSLRNMHKENSSIFVHNEKKEKKESSASKYFNSVHQWCSTLDIEATQRS